MRILGISAFYHDSAAALLRDGRIVAAAQEERFSRRIQDARFPHHAVRYCLAQENIGIEQVEHIVFYEKPFLKFERLMETYMAFAPRGLGSFVRSLPVWFRERLFLKKLLNRELKRLGGRNGLGDRLLFSEHHLSHAASAFFPSPFEEAAVLTLDGAGEWATTAFGLGRQNNLKLIREIHFPHSLGYLYSAFTEYLGFRVHSEEYKVMDLAPFGKPRFKSLILERLMDAKADGTFRLDQSCFNYCTGRTMTAARFHEMFHGNPRQPETEPLAQHHMDVAASIQAAVEELILRLTRSIAQETGARNLCLAGGVAFNCVANGKVLRDKRFEKIWIQPAAGNAGAALGAALAGYHLVKNQGRTVTPGRDTLRGGFLGPAYSQQDIEQRLQHAGARFSIMNDADLIGACADALTERKALGWFQGRMEFGPRALGGRSILADARSPVMLSVLARKLKKREPLQPFVPSVLREDVGEWFELDADSPYALLSAKVAAGRRIPTTAEEENLFGIDKLKVPRSNLPAVTHVDHSARVHTVHREINPGYHALISAFKARTGCPVVINTEFKMRDEPLVNTPEEAFRCFMNTDMEVLAIGNCYLEKDQQNSALREHYTESFDLD